MRVHAGFPLPQIVWVTATVTLLAVVLFPVLAQAREAARQAAETGCLLDTGPCNANPTVACWNSQDGGCKDLRSGLVWSLTSDEATGYYNRVWSREAVPGKIGGAKEYCRDLAEGECPDQPDGLCRGWRVPTKDEAAAAAARQIASYVSMRPGTATGWNRWAGPEYLKGKDLYAYQVRLGTGSSTAVIAQDKKGNYPNAADTICVRTP